MLVCCSSLSSSLHPHPWPYPRSWKRKPLATWQRTGRTARINGELRQISVVFRLDQWPNVRNLGANPLQMAWQRQIKWGEDRQTTYKCCVYCVLLLRVCVVVCVLLRCVLMRQPVTELRRTWDGREGWCLAKASEGRGRVGTTCPISTHSSILSTSYPIPFLFLIQLLFLIA